MIDIYGLSKLGSRARTGCPETVQRSSKPNLTLNGEARTLLRWARYALSKRSLRAAYSYSRPGCSRERVVLVLLQKGLISLRQPTTAHRLCYLIHLIIFIPEALADLPGLVIERRGAAGWIPTLVSRHILEASTSKSKTPSIQVSRRPARKIPVQCQSKADVAPEAQPALVEGQLDVPPPGCSRVKLTLGKPLGIVLEEDMAGNIFIAEVFPEGNAFKSGLVDAGDQLIAVSAVVYNTSEKYGEVEVRKGQEKVRLNVRGESFKTVMAAIGSHPAYIKVDLEIQKCAPVNSGSNNGS